MHLMSSTRTSLLALCALLPTSALADCPVPRTVVDVIEQAEASAESYQNADLVGFVKHTTQL